MSSPRLNASRSYSPSFGSPRINGWALSRSVNTPLLNSSNFLFSFFFFSLFFFFFVIYSLCLVYELRIRKFKQYQTPSVLPPSLNKQYEEEDDENEPRQRSSSDPKRRLSDSEGNNSQINK